MNNDDDKTLEDAGRDGQGAGPLLGLELTTTENKRENQEPSEDSNQQSMLAPLLGTRLLFAITRC